jgi:hypothetical protein
MQSDTALPKDIPFIGTIDAYWLKIQGRELLRFLPKSLGQGFPENTARGVPYIGFISFFLTSFFENLLWASYVKPTSPRAPTLPGVHLSNLINFENNN